MPWIGSFIPLPGLLTGHVGNIDKVYDFDDPNTLKKVTWRVTDAPSGGSVTIRTHNTFDGSGSFVEAIIADGTKFVTKTENLAITDSVWQEVEAESGSAMNLSGEYELVTAEGITVNFCTLAQVKLDARIGTGTDVDRDAVLNLLIKSVTKQMQDWMGRLIVQGTATAEKIDGWGDDSIYTKHFPIRAITSISEEGTALVEDTDFESLEGDKPGGQIVRISGTTPIPWIRGRRNIVLTYDHGFVVLPEALVQAACALTVNKFHETRQSGKGWRGLDSKGVDPNASTAYDKELWTREIIPAMRSYRLLRS